MERSIYVPKFCEYLKEFMSKLEDRFPEEDDFGFLHTAIILALSSGKQERIVLEYYRHVFKYREYLDNRDEDFFMNNDYKSNINVLQSDAQKGNLKIEHFRKMFRSKRVTENDKENAWRYLTLLNKLMDGIIKKKEVELINEA